MSCHEFLLKNERKLQYRATYMLWLLEKLQSTRRSLHAWVHLCPNLWGKRRRQASFVRAKSIVHYYMWETFLFFPRRTREGPSGSSQSLPGSRTGGARDCSSHVSSLKEERSLGLCYRRSSSSRRTVSWRVSILSFSE